MGDNLQNALDNLIGERLAFYEATAPHEQDATELDTAYKALYASLDEKQKGFAIAVENAQQKMLAANEIHYFRCGVSDGVAFVMGLLKSN